MNDNNDLPAPYRAMVSLMREGMVLFAPRSPHGLKVDYPELTSVPEFKELPANEMLFVWAMACRTSPLSSIEPATSRIQACVHFAFQPALRKRMTHVMTTAMPPRVRSAIQRMQAYNNEARISEYAIMQKVRNNIALIADRDLSAENDDARKAYLDQMKVAQSILSEQRSRIEGMDLGLNHIDETRASEAIDIWTEYIRGTTDIDPDTQ